MKQTRDFPSPSQWDAILTKMLQHAEAGAANMLGYPVSTDLQKNRSAKLPQLLAYHWQQGPDPFLELPIIPYAANARLIEKQVVELIMHIYRGKNCWGYVASGGHESNRSALLTARNKFPEGIVYFSAEAHYGVANLVDELRMQHHEPIPTDKTGAIDIDSLLAAINKNKPVILLLTLGTTMLGALDDVTTIIKRLDEAGITQRYIHCDAALHGNYLPFLNDASHINFTDLPIHSLSISPYKVWGSPVPNSVFLVNETLFMKRDAEYVLAKANEARYIPASSRSSLASLGAMDGFVRVGGIKGMRKETRRRMELTQYAVTKLQTIGIDAFANHNSTIIVINDFPINLQFIEYWQLKLEKNKASIVVSGHFTKELVDKFTTSLRKI
jgi:histidine decarboxylase